MIVRQLAQLQGVTGNLRIDVSPSWAQGGERSNRPAPTNRINEIRPTRVGRKIPLSDNIQGAESSKSVPLRPGIPAVALDANDPDWVGLWRTNSPGVGSQFVGAPAWNFHVPSR